MNKGAKRTWTYWIAFILVLAAILALSFLPFVGHAQEVKPKTYPQIAVFNGDTVALIKINQARTIDRVFNERNFLRTENKSLNKENIFLRAALAQKDTAYIKQDDALNLAQEQTAVRDRQVKDYTLQYNNLQANDAKIIRALRWQKYGCFAIIGGLLYLVISRH
jgi:hypothetical protein